MIRVSGGLKFFEQDLNPAVVRDVLSWERHPEVGRILSNLRLHGDRKAFFDTYAEAMVARHLMARDCELRFEVPTPHDRRCDFEVSHGPLRFYLHVKRVDTDRPPRKKLAVSSRLRMLERIPRPYVVQVRWREGSTDEQMQRLVTQAAEFIHQARIGDELKVRDHDGRELGGVRVIAPWEGTHINLTIGLPTGFIDQSPRMRRLLQRAYAQFMPRALNVILICSGHEDDVEDFETALLGSHIERWDAYPPRGKRIAHGRAADGFWSGERFRDSNLAGWFFFRPESDNVRGRIWARPGGHIDEVKRAMIEQLLA